MIRALIGPWGYVAAGLLAAGCASWGTRAVMLGKVARAESSLAAYRSAVATDTANAINDARERERLAADALRASDAAIVSAVRAGFDKAERINMETRNVLASSLAQPEWACLHQPLPAAVVQRLRDAANGTAEADPR